MDSEGIIDRQWLEEELINEDLWIYKPKKMIL